MYMVALASICLSKQDFLNRNETLHDMKITEVEASDNTLRMAANFTGKRYVSVIALNTAMEPSDAACSDGIIKDISPPVFSNVSFENAKWAESIYCHDNKTWLLRANLVKVPISYSLACKYTCTTEHNDRFLDSLSSADGKIDNNSNTTFDIFEERINVQSEFLCSVLPRYEPMTVIYLPSDHFIMHWTTAEDVSQLRDFYVGFGNDASEKDTPELLRYVSTGKKPYFQLHHTGFGIDKEFFVFLKGVNKAGLETILTIGPVLIDQTAPNFRTVPAVNFEADFIVVGWQNDTFYDDEQTEPIKRILFQIGIYFMKLRLFLTCIYCILLKKKNISKRL